MKIAMHISHVAQISIALGLKPMSTADIDSGNYEVHQKHRSGCAAYLLVLSFALFATTDPSYSCCLFV